jgi:hypothetical protein
MVENAVPLTTDYLGLLSNPIHLTKNDVSPSRCAMVKSLMNFWAVGQNQALWNMWLTGTGGTRAVPFWWFDPFSSWRNFHMARSQERGLSRARALTCTGNGQCEYLGYSNPKNMVTYMIWFWQMDVRCQVQYSAVWDKTCCECLTVSATSRCKYTATDTVSFWDDPNKQFKLPPFLVDDQFILGCGYGGKGFKVEAWDFATRTTTVPCRSTLPPYIGPVPHEHLESCTKNHGVSGPASECGRQAKRFLDASSS